MSRQFFGHFLIHRRVITVEWLRDALRLVERTSPTLSHLAVELRMISPEQRDELEEESRVTGHTFGELLEQERLLSEAQVNELLQQSATMRLRLSEALVKLDFVEEAELVRQLDEFEADQAPHCEATLPLPESLARYRPARVVVDLLVGMLPKLTSVEVDVETSPREYAPRPGDISASVLMRGVCPLRVTMHADESLALAITRSMAANPLATPDDDLQAGMAELLNVVLGNAVALLEADGLHLSILPPSLETKVPEGTSVGLATSEGSGGLTLDVPSM
jgi:CheY-specific phosphatase CheX